MVIAFDTEDTDRTQHEKSTQPTSATSATTRGWIRWQSDLMAGDAALFRDTDGPKALRCRSTPHGTAIVGRIIGPAKQENAPRNQDLLGGRRNTGNANQTILMPHHVKHRA